MSKALVLLDYNLKSFRFNVRVYSNDIAPAHIKIVM